MKRKSLGNTSVCMGRGSKSQGMGCCCKWDRSADLENWLPARQCKMEPTGRQCKVRGTDPKLLGQRGHGNEQTKIEVACGLRDTKIEVLKCVEASLLGWRGVATAAAFLAAAVTS